MKLLLHVCCASCGTIAIEKLSSDFELTLFWYNPNIYPIAEYKERLVDFQKLSEIYKLRSIEEKYENKYWFKIIKGLEEEPEGGERCSLCFKMRLEKTVELAKENGFDYWGTTLTTGPQKDAQVINSIGVQLAKKYDLQFYSANFKKEDGFKKSVVLSKKYNFCRQSYCGCIFSQKG